MIPVLVYEFWLDIKTEFPTISEMTSNVHLKGRIREMPLPPSMMSPVPFWGPTQWREPTPASCLLTSTLTHTDACASAHIN